MPLHDQSCEVAELVIAQYRKSATVRVFVYCEGGTNLERCKGISSVVGNILDGTDLFEGGYTLEVSSPGLDRPLQKAVDFRYRIGEMVNIQFAEPKRPSTRAKIVSTSDNEIVFENESGLFTEALANIGSAKIVY